MADWAPVIIGVLLFVLLQPGLLFQLPARKKLVKFGSLKTSGKAIAIHTIIFLTLYSIFLIVLDIHIYIG